MNKPPSRRDIFIDAVARFICENMVEKSIRLQQGNPLAKEWAVVRGASGVVGYMNFEETRAEIVRTLSRDEP